MEEKNSVELKESDIFLFPKEIFYKVLGDNTLVISTNTANWIVINSEKENNIMTLDEAIKHCNEDAKKERERNNIGCMDEHIQLRDWLIELKNYRNNK